MPSPSASRIAYLLLTATALFWGGNAVAGKFAVGHIPPMTLNAVRWTAAFMIILAIGCRTFRRDWPLVRAHAPTLLGLGAIGFSLFNMALYSAAQYTSAVNITIEQAGIPLFVFITNFLLFRTRVAGLQILGFILSIAGVAVVVSGGDLERLAALRINRGDAITLIAVAAYGAYTVALRYKPALDWRSTMIAMTFAAMIASWPFALWEQLSGAGYIPDAAGLAAAAYTAIFPSILSQVFYMRGVDMIGPNRAGLFINLVPVFGTVLAILVLGERLHLFHGVALALVIGGIGLAERGASRASKSGR
ncbi:DMT family transporter [Oricola thermophila]|uniref:DMT family transporter n=1 Tax=Oricola thermophila TaxID=2742145 RepID=A0A6N1V7X0_9HYPH|nr:DMT family transporter [Oricola thermophila]QKV16964.1 DMT family transporter [Oricola thermophila]